MLQEHTHFNVDFKGSNDNGAFICAILLVPNLEKDLEHVSEGQGTKPVRKALKHVNNGEVMVAGYDENDQLFEFMFSPVSKRVKSYKHNVIVKLICL